MRNNLSKIVAFIAQQNPNVSRDMYSIKHSVSIWEKGFIINANKQQ